MVSIPTKQRRSWTFVAATFLLIVSQCWPFQQLMCKSRFDQTDSTSTLRPPHRDTTTRMRRVSTYCCFLNKSVVIFYNKCMHAYMITKKAVIIKFNYSFLAALAFFTTWMHPRPDRGLQWGTSLTVARTRHQLSEIQNGDSGRYSDFNRLKISYVDIVRRLQSNGPKHWSWLLAQILAWRGIQGYAYVSRWHFCSLLLVLSSLQPDLCSCIYILLPLHPASTCSLALNPMILLLLQQLLLQASVPNNARVCLRDFWDCGTCGSFLTLNDTGLRSGCLPMHKSWHMP